MKFLAISALFLSLVSFSSAFADDFPTKPAPELTPGAICTTPESHRYKEQIAYCDRDVSYETKQAVFAEYDRRFGYKIEQMDRSQFKIDHYIPLCMGGANDSSNLWPQHSSVYVITDPLEEALCDKMSQGRLLQADAVNMIKEAKNHLDEAPGILAKVRAL